MSAAEPALETIAQRKLRLLDRLAEAGVQMAEALTRQAEGGPVMIEGDLALAYSRVSRAVRLALMLQEKLEQAPPKSPESAKPSAPDEAHDAKCRAGAIVARVAKADRSDEEEVDRLVHECDERLDDPDLYGDILERPLSEIVARLCRDLGLHPDWSRLAEELWAQDEMLGDDVGAPLIPYLPREAVGGGLLAQERVVEGAGCIHAVPVSLAADSS